MTDLHFAALWLILVGIWINARQDARDGALCLSILLALAAGGFALLAVFS